jgi:hypothetical protein
MRKIIQQITINKEYIFNGERDNLITTLKNVDGMNVKSINNQEFKVYANISWGTLVFSGGGSIDGINIRGTILDIDSQKAKVILKTRIRPEHYFLIVIFVFIMFTLTNESLKTYLYLSGIWIICHLWFQFIYRIQENQLIGKVIDKLKLTKA